MAADSTTVSIHATSVAVAGAAAPFGGAGGGAVLLLGGSGAGKSDVALRLIAMGAQLISDDQTLLFEKDGRLFAGAPPTLRGQMEVRGVGIVTMPAAPPAPVILAVRLEEKAAVPRLPEPASYALPAALSACDAPPLLTLLPFEASTPAKIAAAAAACTRGGFVAGIAPPPNHPFHRK
jgi:hypothetical protein